MSEMKTLNIKIDFYDKNYVDVNNDLIKYTYTPKGIGNVIKEEIVFMFRDFFDDISKLSIIKKDVHYRVRMELD